MTSADCDPDTSMDTTLGSIGGVTAVVAARSITDFDPSPTFVTADTWKSVYTPIHHAVLPHSKPHVPYRVSGRNFPASTVVDAANSSVAPVSPGLDMYTL